MTVGFSSRLNKHVYFDTQIFRLASPFQSTINDFSDVRETQLAEDYEKDGIPHRETILTAKGVVTYEEIDRNIFYEWLEIAKQAVPPDPPREIKETQKNAFLLNGYSTLYQNSYYNGTAVPQEVIWDNIEQLMKAPRNEVIQYDHEGLVVYYALRGYPLRNMEGLVIGSQHPWIEVQALRSGAAKVYTVEYQKTKIVGTTKIKYIHPVEFAKRWKEYGDPLDPIGDLREVLKVMCLLKKGGLFFVGFPRGKDAIKYNAHRYYGRIRIAMIMTGFAIPERLAEAYGTHHSDVL
ncbi:hypothetical protein ANCCEY_11327 [Ancylostoma ceylanicum]|uniref:Uncharacterized protein n=1 Tax=Ancylostoma ceylanicum TaxID=53326 RepID=A0A0D6LEE1_9BILA|nr:hypothetical protein ANCCEY_11327 [Ancylostoma ceylanicum]